MSAARLSDEDVERVARRVLELLGTALAGDSGVPASNGNGHGLIDAKAAAGLLGVPESWIRSEARAGRLPHVPVGRYTRFRSDELLDWVDARAQGPFRTRAGSRPVSRPRERP